MLLIQKSLKCILVVYYFCSELASYSSGSGEFSFILEMGGSRGGAYTGVAYTRCESMFYLVSFPPGITNGIA